MSKLTVIWLAHFFLNFNKIQEIKIIVLRNILYHLLEDGFVADAEDVGSSVVAVISTDAVVIGISMKNIYEGIQHHN